MSKRWFNKLFVAPAGRAEKRAQELREVLMAALDTWPGDKVVSRDSRKVKAIIDDEGIPLQVMIWVEVQPVDMAVKDQQELRRKMAARRLREQAAAIEKPAPVTGTVVMTAKMGELLRLMQGDR